MTENTVTENTPAVWEPATDAARAIFGEVVSLADQYNSLQRKVDAASGDVTPLVEDAWRNSDDKNVVKAREKYDALISEAEDLRAQVAKMLAENFSAAQGMSEDEISAARESLTEIRAEYKAGVNFLTKRFPEAESAVPALLGTRTVKSGGASGATGGRKPRVSTIYVNGEPATDTVVKDGKERVISTFTLASKKMGGAPVPEIHKAYFAAAGTDDLDALPATLEFAFTHKDVNYLVRVDK